MINLRRFYKEKQLYIIVVIAVVLLFCFVGYIATSFFNMMQDNMVRRVESSGIYEQWLLTKSAAEIFLTSGKQPELKTNVNMNIKALDKSFAVLEGETAQMFLGDDEFKDKVPSLLQNWNYVKYYLLEIVSNEDSYRNFETQIFWLSNDTNRFSSDLKELSSFMDRYHRRQLNILWKVFLGLIFLYLSFTAIFIFFFNRFSKTHRAEQEYKQLLAESMENREIEKQNMVLEIHDTVIQDMVYSKMLCMDLVNQYKGDRGQEQIMALTNKLAGALQQMRDISYGIRPPELEKNLDEIVSNYVKNWEIKTGRKADYSAIGLESVKVKNSLKLNIYRIIQELMTNIEKHSDATEVKINIIISWPSLLLKVSDNGGGFNLEQALEKSDGKSHSGLRGVMERVKISKGTIKIKFLQERGTVVNIKFPLEDIDD
ncbi:MAG: hypothetical protein IJT92_02140 [Spirochaetia bacterium]|nr:hypothetical protein [Spirochaetia bacterium]